MPAAYSQKVLHEDPDDGAQNEGGLGLTLLHTLPGSFPLFPRRRHLPPSPLLPPPWRRHRAARSLPEGAGLSRPEASHWLGARGAGAYWLAGRGIAAVVAEAAAAPALCAGACWAGDGLCVPPPVRSIHRYISCARLRRYEQFSVFSLGETERESY